MQWVVVFGGLTVYFLFLLIFWKAGQAKVHMEKRLNAVYEIGNQGKKYNDEEMGKPFVERFLKPIFNFMVSNLGKAMPQPKGNRLEKQLKLAGIKLKPNEYTAACLIAQVGITIGAIVVSAFLHLGAEYIFFIAILGFVGTMVIQRFLLGTRVTSRQVSMKKQLPEVLDLLSVSVEAGLGFDAALLHLTERLKGPLIDEFIVMHRELLMGLMRRVALKNLADRCGFEDMRSFAGAVIQADQMGISLKNVLQAQGKQMRQQRKQAVEEVAMKAPVKIMIPMALFIFPVLFIILMGPAVVQLISTFKGM